MSYRPDLLFHQQYPTRYGSKVTRCQMPSDTVPTVTRLAPEPRGDGVSASIRRRWGWMGGMVNTCELLINVVTSGKPKVLVGLGQKGTVAGTRTFLFLVMGSNATGGQSAPPPFVVTETEHGNPVRPPQGKASRKA